MIRSLAFTTRTMRPLFALAIASVAVGCAHTPSTPAAIPPELRAIEGYTFGDSREALTAVEDLVREALKSPTDAQRMSGQLATLLNPNATLECRDFACRQLYLVGTDNAVPALAKLLRDEQTTEMARYALEAIPGEAANSALLDALNSAPRSAQVGIVNSLGARHDPASRATLERLAAQNNALSDAARAALEKLGD